MTPEPTNILARIVFADPLGPNVAAGAAGVLACVLLWHFVSMLRQGRWRHWTCWSAGVVAAITCVWLIALVTSDAFDNAWTKLFLLGLLSITTAVVVYHSVYRYLGAQRVGVLLALRCAAMAVLILLLFKPAIGNRPDDDQRPLLLVMIDRSQSMNEADASAPGQEGAGRMRFTAAVDAVLAEQEKLGSYYDVRYYLFDQTAEPVDHAGALADASPTGEGTYLDTSLSALSQAARDERAKAIIVISDGIHNGPSSAVAAVDAMPRPVLLVGVGGPVAEGAAGRDVALARVTAPAEAFSNNVARVDLDVTASGYAGQQATAVLRQVGGEKLGETTIDLAEGVARQATIEFTPRQIGVMDLEVELSPMPGESVAANNRHRLSIRVGEPQIKVLYIEGSIRTEYRHLRIQLSGDQHVELITLIQMRKVGAEGAQFTVTGTVGGKRLGGMPATAEQLALFDVVILGDLDSTYLSREQMQAMQQFVRDGKGLLMIGGSHSFGPGGYGGTPIEQMLGVQMGPRTIGQETMAFHMALTTAGKVHDIFGGLVNYISPPADQPASQLPELTGCVTVQGAKPGADVLAVHPNRKTPDGKSLLPVLTVQKYGKGRTAAFTADTTWRWKMFRTVAAYEGVYERFWGQLIRWLASSELIDRKGQSAAVLSTPRSFYAPGQSIPMTVRVWGGDGQPVEEARVEVEVTTPGDGGKVPLVLSAVKDAPGLYAGSYRPDVSGKFALAMSARRSGQLLGSGEQSVEVGRPGAEASKRSADIELLKRLADAGKPALLDVATAGPIRKYTPLSEYDQLVDQLTLPWERRRLAPRPQELSPSYSPTQHAGAMLLFVALLTCEWFLRRRWQLQ